MTPATKTKTSLGSVAKVISGYAFKSSSFTESGVPVIKIKNIRVGSVDLTDSAFVSESFLDINQKYHIHDGDILISLTGSHISQPNSVVGRVALNKNKNTTSLLNQRAGKISVTDPDKVDRVYLYYKLSTKEYRRKIAMMASGAASQANVSPTQVESLDLELPPLSKQLEVSETLLNYDLLIENNLQRIAILETMARQLYDRHLKTPVAAEWDSKSIADVTSLITRGISPTYNEAGEILALNQRCIRDNKIDLTNARPQSKKVTEAKLVLNGDVLINSTGVGTLGRLAQAEGLNNNVTVDSHVSLVRPNDDINPYFFGASLIDKQGEFERLGTGATGQTELGRDAIGRVSIIVPPKPIRDEIGNSLKPIRRLVSNLQKKNLLLNQARDLLLPRLVFEETEV